MHYTMTVQCQDIKENTMCKLTLFPKQRNVQNTKAFNSTQKTTDNWGNLGTGEM